MLTDDVWAQLDHGAARLPRTQQRRLYLALGALLIAAQLGVLTWLSGAITPRLQVAEREGTSAHVEYHTSIGYVVSIHNDGWFPVTIIGWGSSRPGLQRYHRPGEMPGFTLKPGAVQQVEVAYRITDCNAVTNEPQPLAVRVQRFWGTQTVNLPLPRQLPPGFQGMWRGDEPMEWDLYWTKVACKATD